MDDRLFRLILTAALIVGILLFRWLITYFLIGRIANLKTRYNWNKITTYFSYFVLFISIAVLWLHEFQSAATFLGLLSAGLAVALKDPIINFFGWLFIIFNRPFEMGHRVEIDGNRGDVINIRFFEFTLLEIGEWVDANQSTGRIVHIPNGKVFTKSIINYVQGFQFIWHEIPVLITFQSNWQKAKQLLLDIEREHVATIVDDAKLEIDESERRFNVQYSKLTPTVYTTVKESGILLTLRFLTPPRKQRHNEQLVWEAILEAFKKEEDIAFAYPTQRVFLEEKKK